MEANEKKNDEPSNEAKDISLFKVALNLNFPEINRGSGEKLYAKVLDAFNSLRTLPFNTLRVFIDEQQPNPAIDFGGDCEYLTRKALSALQSGVKAYPVGFFKPGSTKPFHFATVAPFVHSGVEELDNGGIILIDLGLHIQYPILCRWPVPDAISRVTSSYKPGGYHIGQKLYVCTKNANRIGFEVIEPNAKTGDAVDFFLEPVELRPTTKEDAKQDFMANIMPYFAIYDEDGAVKFKLELKTKKERVKKEGEPTETIWKVALKCTGISNNPIEVEYTAANLSAMVNAAENVLRRYEGISFHLQSAISSAAEVLPKWASENYARNHPKK